MKIEIMQELVETLVIGHSITSKEVYDVLSKQHGEISNDIKVAVNELSREMGSLRETFTDLESHADDEPKISSIEVWYDELGDRVSDLKSSMDGLMEKINELEGEIDA